MAHAANLILAARSDALPLVGRSADYDRLVAMCGDARVVCIGEASHGTHEFYRERAEITRRLIVEKGFRAVAVEADWPDAFRVTRYVRGESDDRDAERALAGFDRFPTWMWRNTEVVRFVEWLRAHNDQNDDDVPFYGMDLYSLYRSAQSSIAYLESVDADAAARAKARYGCFDHAAEDTQMYGYATSLGLREPCQKQAIAQLVELCARKEGGEELFDAQANARLVKNAEQYYRAMFDDRVSSWNLRDRHMVETLAAIERRLEKTARPAKIVVWAHNSHLGDARATDRAEVDELNVGQLARERWGADAFLIGMTTFTGTVTAASSWGDEPERMNVRPALANSVEDLFHATMMPRFLLPLRDARVARAALAEPRLERAIGVIYRPDSERLSHYFDARISEQFDAVLHIDETRALEAIDRPSRAPMDEVPETYPSSL